MPLGTSKKLNNDTCGWIGGKAKRILVLSTEVNWSVKKTSIHMGGEVTPV